MKNTISPHSRKTITAWVLGIFSLFVICASVYAAAGRCVPCKANWYCIAGTPYICPADRPVTNGTGHDNINDCMSCETRNGAGQAFFGGYHLGEGYECISCLENDLTKPFWNGSECVACATADASKPVWNNGVCEACPDNKTWDGEACVAQAAPTSCNANGVCTLTAAVNECEAGYIAITTAEQLAKIGVDANYPLTGSYCLMNDISLAAYSTGGGVVIGGPDNSFTGVFDGNWHVISDLYINRPNTNYQGLFGDTLGATIRNLGVNANITGDDFVGGLVGYMDKGTISNSYVSGTVNGRAFVGGLVGCSEDGIITNTYAAVNVTGSFDTAGGLVGTTTGGGIFNSLSTGSVAGESCVGGLVGYSEYASIISNCYATGSVTGTDFLGGLVGFNDPDCIISNSHYDKITTGQATSCGENRGICDATGKTTAEMQTPQTFIDAGWDTTIWELVQGQYPKLKGVGGQ